MGEDVTLRRVAEDLAAGRTALARQRLRGLVGSMPQRLDHRERLAAVYRAEGDLAQAGRWSYLADERDPEEVAAFERAYAEDPVQLMKALGWRGTEDDAATETARERLRALRSRAEAQFGVPVEWGRPQHPQPPPTLGDRLGDVGCALAALVLAVLVVVGVASAAVHGAQVVAGWAS